LKSTTQIFGLFAFMLTAGALTAQNIQVDRTALSFSTQVAGQAVNQTLNVTSSGASIAFVAAANAQWLKVNGGTFANGNTPSAVTVTADPTGLAQGTYTGQITVSGGSGPSVVVQVTFALGSIGVNPASLQFSSVVGSVPSSQTVALSGQPATFTAAATTLSGGNWLQVSPTTGVSPSNLLVTFDPAISASLQAGTYNGSVTITPTSGASLTPIVIPVTLSVTTSPAVTVNPTNITLNYQIGGANNVQVSQPLTINNAGGTSVSFGVSPSVENNPSGRVWLTATPSSGSIPANGSAQITLAYDTTANLPAGTYGGNNTKVTLSTPGATPPTRDIPVTLLVSTAPLLNVPNAALAFTYQQGAQNPNTQSVTATSTAVAATSTSGQLSLSITSTTQTGGNWLFVPSTGVTGTPITVTVNPAGLAPGNYTGTVTVTGNGAANGPQSFPVTLLVSNDPLISVNGCTASNQAACGITFPFQIGQSAPNARNVTVTSTSNTTTLNYSAGFTPTNCGQWLVLTGAAGGSTTGTFTLSINPLTIQSATQANNCTGVVTVTATNPATGASVANSPVSIPVTLVVDPNPLLVVTPSTPLSFQAQVNGTPTPSQVISIGGTNPTAPLNFSISFTPTNGGNWLLVGPTSGSTTSGLNQITISANPGLLSAGTYTGTINVTATNPSGATVTNSPVAIPVSLQVGTPVAAGPTVTLNPTSLTFSTAVNAPTAPQSQTIAVASGGTPIAYTTSTSVTGGGANWLSVTPASGTTPGNLTVSIDQTKFTTANTYTGTVTVTAPGAANTPVTLQVTVNVAAPPTPTLTAVRNAASYSAGVIAPGENIVLGGTNIGPGTLAQLQLNQNGGVATTIGNTRVLFDGIPAPMVYASGNQTSVMVPYEIAGRASTNIQVEYQGVTSQAIPFTVAQSAPGIYTQNQQGTGPGAILNQDYSVNGPGRAAAKGSVVQVYMTGEGQTSPAGVTGYVAPNTASGQRTPVLPVTASIGGMTANVLYAGSAPGFISGLMQVNLLVPANAPSGAQPIVISIGGTQTQAGVTVSIQ
jgi:uncharacterized protein (TIGR03437 family)